jgi:sulfate adenylyltransferase
MNKTLDEREKCDIECLLNGSFAPLTNYMTKNDYERCLVEPGFYPIPVVCSVDTEIPLNTVLSLKDVTGIVYATLLVKECWIPNMEVEWNAIFGCTDDTHPYISYMKSKNAPWYVSGKLEKKADIEHTSFLEYRKTPAEVSALGKFVGFQTRNPLHRSHVEVIKRSAGGLPILLHPVEGVTQDCDVPFPVRMACYKKTLKYLGNVTLSILTLSMRMAGPREAVWHAMIRKNYGCSHFIVGRDHAGPSYKKKNGSPFYSPVYGQILAKSLEQTIGIKIIASEELVYCDNIDGYCTLSQSINQAVRNISGTEFRHMLENDQEIPSWYAYPEVVAPLREFYRKKVGQCFYFIGLSGSGKSTLANSFKGKLSELYPALEVTMLDADEIRTNLSKGLGFSKEDRSANVRRIGYVCSEIVRHGGIVLVANIAPYQADRDYNKKLITRYGKYHEIFVDTPVEVCEKRDLKGLYKLAREGSIPNFTGISDPFERPTDCIRIELTPKHHMISETNKLLLKLL